VHALRPGHSPRPVHEPVLLHLPALPAPAAPLAASGAMIARSAIAGRRTTCPLSAVRTAATCGSRVGITDNGQVLRCRASARASPTAAEGVVGERRGGGMPRRRAQLGRRPAGWPHCVAPPCDVAQVGSNFRAHHWGRPLPALARGAPILQQRDPATMIMASGSADLTQRRSSATLEARAHRFGVSPCPDVRVWSTGSLVSQRGGPLDGEGASRTCRRS
jgi:hypothetical protein